MSSGTPVGVLAEVAGSVVILVLLGLALVLGWRRTHGPRTVRVGTAATPSTMRLQRATDLRKVELGPWPVDSPFAPFLRTFARRGIAMRDPVVLARSGGQVVGAYVVDSESEVGGVYGPLEPALRTLLSMQRVPFVFLEERNGQPPGTPAGFVPVDRYDVLRLEPVSARAFESGIVRPMAAADLPGVVQIAQTTYFEAGGGRGLRGGWMDGDVALVAEVAGRIAGFAFATVEDGAALLYGLTVHPQFRGQGLGRELMAGRLSALAAMGVQRAVVEVSPGNPAAHRIAMAAGFVRCGGTVYFSARATDAPDVGWSVA